MSQARATCLDFLTKKFSALDVSVIGDVLTENSNNLAAADHQLTMLYGAPAQAPQPQASPVKPVAAPVAAGGDSDANAIRDLKQMTGLSDTIILGAYLQQGKDMVVALDTLLNIAEDREAIQQLRDMTRDQVVEHQRKVQAEDRKRKQEAQQKRDGELARQKQLLEEAARQEELEKLRIAEAQAKVAQLQREAQERQAQEIKLRQEAEKRKQDEEKRKFEYQLKQQSEEVAAQRAKEEAYTQELQQRFEAERIEKELQTARMKQLQERVDLDRKEAEENAKRLVEAQAELARQLHENELAKVKQENFTLTVEYSSNVNKCNVYWAMGSKYKPTASDWFGVYRKGEVNKSYLQSHRTKGESEGWLEIDFPAKPGMYEIRFFLNNSYDDVSVSQPIHVGPHMELQSVLMGDKVRLSWRLISGKLGASDWIGFYRIDKSGNNYTSCHYPLKHPDNFIEIEVPRRGGYSYDFRFVPYACGYPILRTEPLFIPSKDKVAFELVNNGTQAKITWVCASFDSANWINRDWIGLYREGARNNYYESYQYADHTNKFLLFDVPRIPGKYEFRYHSGKQSASRHLAISEPLTVVDRDHIVATNTAGFIRAEWEIFSVDASTSDWVGLFKEGDANTAYLKDSYVDTKKKTHVFPLPTEPGNYNVRYFAAARGKYDALKVSNTIVVV